MKREDRRTYCHAGSYILLIAAAGFVVGWFSSPRAMRAEERASGSGWTIIMRGLPDAAGRGSYACQGCDGQLTGADRFAAAGRPLTPVRVRILRGNTVFDEIQEDPYDRWVVTLPSPTATTPGDPSPTPTPTVTPSPSPTRDPSHILWEGELEYHAASQMLFQVARIDQPPPYIVHLMRNPEGYAHCPNTPHVVLLRQSDFDAERGRRAGTGRRIELQWSFWSCPTDRLGEELPLFSSIFDWLR